MGLLLSREHLGSSQEIISHRCPLLAEARRFQKDMADGTAVPVPVGHVALLAEQQRSVEAFGNGKTKPRSQQLCSLGCVCMADANGR